MNNAFKPVARRRLSDDIIDQIKAMIRDSDLKPGNRLPSERDMVDMFQVGRAPIREAIRTLSLLGVLEVRQGHGVFVKEFNTSNLMDNLEDSLEFLVGLEKKTIIELLEVRRILEAHTAYLASGNATEDDLRNLENAFEKLPQAKREYEKKATKQTLKDCVDADYHFHHVLASCSHNGVLQVITTSIKSLVQRSSLKYESYPYPLEKLTEFIDEHRRVLEAVQNRSPEQAAQAMTAHLSHAQSVLSKLIDI